MGKYLQNARKYFEWVNIKGKFDALAPNCKRKVHRGSVYWCNFGINIGSEQEDNRPCVVLQNASGNEFSLNTIVAPITHTNSTLDIVVPISNKYDKTGKQILDGNVLLGNLITVSKARLGNFITKLDRGEMKKVDDALIISIDILPKIKKFENLLKNANLYTEKLRNIIKEKDVHIEELQHKLEEKEKYILQILKDNSLN